MQIDSNIRLKTSCSRVSNEIGKNWFWPDSFFLSKFIWFCFLCSLKAIYAWARYFDTNLANLICDQNKFRTIPPPPPPPKVPPELCRDRVVWESGSFHFVLTVWQLVEFQEWQILKSWAQPIIRYYRIGKENGQTARKCAKSVNTFWPGSNLDCSMWLLNVSLHVAGDKLIIQMNCYRVVLSCGTVYYAEQGGSNLWVCERNRKVWPFNERYWAVLSFGLFIMLFNVVLSFESVDEILQYDHSVNPSYGINMKFLSVTIQLTL